MPFIEGDTAVIKLPVVLAGNVPVVSGTPLTARVYRADGELVDTDITMEYTDFGWQALINLPTDVGVPGTIEHMTVQVVGLYDDMGRTWETGIDVAAKRGGG